MRQKEDYSSYVLTALILTIAIIVIFQIYIFREPARIKADLKAENQHQVAEGSELYAENCIACHGESGQGGVGPALNSRPLLAIASDQALFNLTVSGVPGTIMPAWGQFFGGPFTDEQVLNLVAFIRAWEPNAPEPALVGDALPNATSGAGNNLNWANYDWSAIPNVDLALECTVRPQKLDKERVIVRHRLCSLPVDRQLNRRTGRQLSLAVRGQIVAEEQNPIPIVDRAGRGRRPAYDLNGRQ